MSYRNTSESLGECKITVEMQSHCGNAKLQWECKITVGMQNHCGNAKPQWEHKPEV